VLVTPALSACGAVIAELPTGLRIPQHHHTGRELTLILDGELADESSRTYGPGDVMDMAIGTEHKIAVVGEHPCLAVFSNVPQRG
jgi:anti-sigma factor ChrR (cupin superfamily)